MPRTFRGRVEALGIDLKGTLHISIVDGMVMCIAHTFDIAEMQKLLSRLAEDRPTATIHIRPEGIIGEVKKKTNFKQRLGGWLYRKGASLLGHPLPC